MLYVRAVIYPAYSFQKPAQAPAAVGIASSLNILQLQVAQPSQLTRYTQRHCHITSDKIDLCAHDSVLSWRIECYLWLPSLELPWFCLVPALLTLPRVEVRKAEVAV